MNCLPALFVLLLGVAESRKQVIPPLFCCRRQLAWGFFLHGGRRVCLSEMTDVPAAWRIFRGLAFPGTEVAPFSAFCAGSNAVSGRMSRPGADSEKRKIRPNPLSLEVPVGFCSEKFTSFHCPPVFLPPEQLSCPEADFGADATPAWRTGVLAWGETALWMRLRPRNGPLRVEGL